MKLNEIADNPGASKSRMRVGRGIGSGKGKTCGRGVKGQKARTGVSIKGFEGGQMPLHRRLPKRGFRNPSTLDYNEVNLGRIQAAVDAGKLDPATPVTIEALVAAGVCAKPRDGVKILGKGELSARLAFEVTAASKSAVAAIEGAGGSHCYVKNQSCRRRKSRLKLAAAGHLAGLRLRLSWAAPSKQLIYLRNYEFLILWSRYRGKHSGTNCQGSSKWYRRRNSSRRM